MQLTYFQNRFYSSRSILKGKWNFIYEARMISKKIYVGNLKFTLKEENIRQIFSVYGAIQDLKMIHDRETGNFRGFAFITYATDEAASDAVTQMNGQEVDGRSLKVTFAEDKRKERQQ